MSCECYGAGICRACKGERALYAQSGAEVAVERLCAAVVISEGNTEINEVYLWVRFLGHVIWSCGGQRKDVAPAAERAAESFRARLRKAATGEDWKDVRC